MRNIKNNLATFISLGEMSFFSKKYDVAIQYYTAAIKLNPNSCQKCIIHINRGAAKYYLGQYREAAEDFIKAIESKQSSIACKNLVLTHRKIEQLEAQEKAMKKINQIKAAEKKEIEEHINSHEVHVYYNQADEVYCLGKELVKSPEKIKRIPIEDRLAMGYILFSSAKKYYEKIKNNPKLNYKEHEKIEKRYKKLEEGRYSEKNLVVTMICHS